MTSLPAADSLSDYDAGELHDPARDVRFAMETYGELRPARDTEWLLTNGLGGFASGTVAQVATRRYHALLVAATLPPVGRVVLLSRLAEVLVVDGDSIDLSGAYFRDKLTGDGPAMLRRFELAGDVAQWELDYDATKIYKQVVVCWQRNTVGIRYRVVPGPRHEGKTMSLHLSPFVAMRDFHAARHVTDSFFQTSAGERQADVNIRDLHISFVADAGRYDEEPDWWYAHSYPVEKARGLDDREDLFTPGTFSLDIEGESAITLWASDGDAELLDWEQVRADRRDGMKLPELPTRTQRELVRAAADFVVRRRNPDGTPGTTVIAGYPWFGDWGRDTFIALPGLLLTTGRHQTAGRVLSTFAQHVSEGMIPNVFDDYTNQPHYNTVDASLWFIHAAHAYLKATHDRDTYESLLLPACEEIVEGYSAGTRYGIGVDPADGLVTAGDANTQLTWMDARYEGTAFTPRHGKAVEINALWYHALRCLGRDDEADRVRESFQSTFWRPDGRGLFDVITNDKAVGKTGGKSDDSIRPNQIFAVSLRHSPLDTHQQATVVDVVRRELLTPFGLRTLAKDDEKFQPRYFGVMEERDRAYHNGTVWPWLMGAFLDAHLRINDNSRAARDRARTWLSPIIQHLRTGGCFGSVSEVFDATFPYRPGGCFAQAWSVAEVFRLAVELEM